MAFHETFGQERHGHFSDPFQWKKAVKWHFTRYLNEIDAGTFLVDANRTSCEMAFAPCLTVKLSHTALIV